MQETITPEQIKTLLTNSNNSANEIIGILEDKHSEDKHIKIMLEELKYHVKVLSFFN